MVTVDESRVLPAASLMVAITLITPSLSPAMDVVTVHLPFPSTGTVEDTTLTVELSPSMTVTNTEPPASPVPATTRPTAVTELITALASGKVINTNVLASFTNLTLVDATLSLGSSNLALTRIGPSTNPAIFTGTDQYPLKSTIADA